jgi:hypothetical protein
MIVGPDGDVLVEAGPDEDGTCVFSGVSRPHLQSVRSTNPSLANRRL